MDLARSHCKPCEGGVPPLGPQEAAKLHEQVPEWTLEPKRLRRSWVMEDFAAGMAFLSRIAEVAEAQGHHPDLYLRSYRNVEVVLWTHAVGGLSENDFILAARIDRVAP